MKLIGFQQYNVHTKFCENRSVNAKFRWGRHTHRQHDDLRSLLFPLRKEKWDKNFKNNLGNKPNCRFQQMAESLQIKQLIIYL
jgi:hypothetical protein